MKGAGRWILLAVVAVVGMALLGGPGAVGADLDPTSTSARGLAGLARTLDRLGADVSVETVDLDDSLDVLVLAQDQLSAERRRDVDEWVAAGGTVVVLDSLSPLIDASRAGRTESGLVAGCHEGAIDPKWRMVSAVEMLSFASPDARLCFEAARSAWLVISDRGDGQVIAVGDPTPFVNDHLGRADHAAIAAALIAGENGSVAGRRIGFAAGPRPGEGQQSLRELIPAGVWAGLLQAALAVAAWVAWRGRRLGAPVVDDRPTLIDGVETVEATGRLWGRLGDADDAVARLADDLAAELAARLGNGSDGADPGADRARLADAAAAAGVASRDDVAAALQPRPGADLVEQARRIAAVRRGLRSDRSSPMTARPENHHTEPEMADG